MKFWKLSFLLSLSACQMTGVTGLQPAVLTQSGAASAQELRRVIGELSGFLNVLLADDDLTRSSELVVERRHQFRPNGDLIQGRDLDLPQRFRLLQGSGQCWLLHLNSGQQRLLQGLSCRSLTSASTISPAKSE
ncbi:hypothetical protein [Undibacterium rugosum]|uniref:Uncharacterized protein n=1 Tax=Undibacterium rugosum TaxID=2762291 RepID=A0A923KW15_9BURK|nr:hypothetical protein [Undibacterium rugosum]MBC3936022.1 hypothetical protein [Undibacterium rugosum]MBR7778645.1 hypothetical protein [Undibacterium rugosum]